MKMTKAQMQKKIDDMAKGITSYRAKVKTLEANVSNLEYRLKLAKEGRRFWRSEAKKHGTTYDYHSQALRKEGRFDEVYTR